MLDLARPRLDLVDSYLDFIQEMRDHREKIWEGFVPNSGESNSDFVQRILKSEHRPAISLVPETTYWAVVGPLVVGRIALRHHLNPKLEEFGGHIGYEVRPSSRRKGYAKEMLQKILRTDKAREIGELLLTCAPDNLASNKTILANGGVLVRTAYVEKWKRDTNYYRIDLTAVPSGNDSRR